MDDLRLVGHAVEQPVGDAEAVVHPVRDVVPRPGDPFDLVEVEDGRRKRDARRQVFPPRFLAEAGELLRRAPLPEDLGQQQRGPRAVGLGDDVESGRVPIRVGGQQAEALLQGELILLDVPARQVAPVPERVPAKAGARILRIQALQGVRGDDALPERPAMRRPETTLARQGETMSWRAA